MWLVLLELAISISCLVVILTQVTIPLLSKKPLFPLLSRRERLVERLQLLEAVEDEQQLAQQVHRKAVDLSNPKLPK